MIEVFTVGTEVLHGYTINSNAGFISQELLKIGFIVGRHTTVSDDFEELKKGLQEACQRSNLIIATGGLGPTLDDVTRKVVCEIVDSEFTFDRRVAADLKRRFGDHLKSLDNQATVPEKATVILNRIGTAPGFIVQHGKTTLILLPGVPLEMGEMFTKDILPYLEKHFRYEKRLFSKRLHLVKLFESDVDPFVREILEKYPDLNCGIYADYGFLTLDLMIYSGDADKACPVLDKASFELENKFHKHIYQSGSGHIAEAIQDRFVANGWTLSCAESCTGGAIASCITRYPGSSEYFLGSLVAYSNRLKKDLLDVDEKLIDEKGAVSEEVVCEMCHGLLRKTKSDYGIAVTGIAGPAGGTSDKPVGTVWAAIGRKDHVHAWKMHLRGTREAIIRISVNAVLGELYLFTN